MTTTDTVTINTMEELSKLPPYTVIRTKHGHVFERMHSDGEWLMPGVRDKWRNGEIALPATVIYQPQEES